MQEFIDQLFKTTSSKFSPTPPREPTPPRDSSKGKAVAIIEEPRNELEFDKQIKELKRISDLKAEKEKSKQELRKFLNPATLKAQVINQAKRLGLPPPPKLATFRLTAEEKKRKRAEEVLHRVCRWWEIDFQLWRSFSEWDECKIWTSANIPCNSVMDDDLEDETDDDMGYDPSDVAFIEWLRSKIFNYKTMDQYTMKALWIYWIRGDDEVGIFR
ncbi:hypothetical protein Tco_0164474 [Tanacetum coccineum]